MVEVKPRQFHLVLPSLKVSGGTREALRLAGDLACQPNCSADVLALWQSPHPIPEARLPLSTLSHWRTRVALALFQLPVLAVRFFRHVRRDRRLHGGSQRSWIFTHYSTLPLALLVPRAERWYFVQGLEWHFVQHRWLAGELLERFILAMYRRGRVVTANEYLSQQLGLHGVAVAAEAPIWADARFAVAAAGLRDIDIVMMPRKGVPKRLDLYRRLIETLVQRSPHIRLALITPEDDIAATLGTQVHTCLLRPDLPAMAALYARSRLFAFLSESEGFGLPPLEAMGAGCVPLCRDSGGVRAYMKGPLQALLVPLQMEIDAVADRLLALLTDEPQRAALGVQAARVFREGLARADDRVQALSPLYH